MKNMLLAVGLGTMVALGGCANKQVTPKDSIKPAGSDSALTSGGSSSNGIGASSSAVGPGYNGTTPDSTMTTSTPTIGSGDTAGGYVPPVHHTGATPKKPSTTVKTASVTKTPTADKAVATSAHPKKYTVKKGDTLSAIAKKYYGKTSAIKKIVAANPGMDPNKIRIGQVINLPA